jgi:pycsar effector protein
MGLLRWSVPASRLDPTDPPVPRPPATDDAWRALTLQIDMVRHAETKAAAALTSSGVLGGLLYTLVSHAKHPGAGFVVIAAAAALAIVTAATAAGVALRPRIYLRNAKSNLLFYGSIVRRFGDDADAFSTDFAALLADRAAMISAVTAQIHGNANVAIRKYRAVDVSIMALLAALALLASTALAELAGW